MPCFPRPFVTVIIIYLFILQYSKYCAQILVCVCLCMFFFFSLATIFRVCMWRWAVNLNAHWICFLEVPSPARTSHERLSGKSGQHRNHMWLQIQTNKRGEKRLKWVETSSHLWYRHIQVDKESRGRSNLQHYHHYHHHSHPHLGRRFPARCRGRPACRDHHVGGWFAAHRSEIILLLCARSGHGIPDAWVNH